MTMTVTLSAELSAQLQAYAQQLHLSPEVVVEQVLTAALSVQETNGFHGSDTPAPSTAGTDDAELAAVIAQIKATPPNPMAIEQGSKVDDKVYLQYLLEHSPTDTLTMVEWEVYWPLVEQELKELDRTHSAED